MNLIQFHIYVDTCFTDSSVGTCFEEKQKLILDGNIVSTLEEVQEIVEDKMRKEGRVEITVYK